MSLADGQAEAISDRGNHNGDMETGDSMGYWELEVIGCDSRAGHQKEVQSGS